MGNLGGLSRIVSFGEAKRKPSPVKPKSKPPVKSKQRLRGYEDRDRSGKGDHGWAFLPEPTPAKRKS